MPATGGHRIGGVARHVDNVAGLLRSRMHGRDAERTLHQLHTGRNQPTQMLAVDGQRIQRKCRTSARQHARRVPCRMGRQHGQEAIHAQSLRLAVSVAHATGAGGGAHPTRRSTELAGHGRRHQRLARRIDHGCGHDRLHRRMLCPRQLQLCWQIRIPAQGALRQPGARMLCSECPLQPRIAQVKQQHHWRRTVTSALSTTRMLPSANRTRSAPRSSTPAPTPSKEPNAPLTRTVWSRNTSCRA